MLLVVAVPLLLLFGNEPLPNVWLPKQVGGNMAAPGDGNGICTLCPDGGKSDTGPVAAFDPLPLLENGPLTGSDELKLNAFIGSLRPGCCCNCGPVA